MGNQSSTQLQFTLIDNKERAEDLLEQAEKTDLYLTECHDDKNNSYARRQLTYVPNAINMLDTRFYTLTLDNMKDNIPVRLLTDLGVINIIQLMPSADGGMPHTRPGNIICYPDIQKISSISTLVHELWHIHQRNFQDIWKKVFHRLGWTEWKGKLPLLIENNTRYNPDTIDSPLWIFKNTWIPVPVFNDISTPKINSVTIWFYNNMTHYHSKTIPDEIQELFPNLPSSAYEHPRELTAYMLSEPSTQQNSPGYKALIEAVGHLSVMPDHE